jgi:dolichol-phosphate mannosyltransferase
MTASGSGPGGPGAPRVELSVILATINERRALPQLVDRLRALALPSFEVLVVDDGSTDGTREYLADLHGSDPRFRPIFHDGKQTTLRAQCQGIAASTGDLVVVMDADLQHPPETLPEIARALQNGSTLVVASRYVPPGSPGARTISRIIISRVAELTARMLLRETRPLTDPISGFFGFRREIYRPIDRAYRGYKLLLYLLVMNGGRPVAEVGFQFAPRAGGESKLTQGFGFIRVFLGELLRARKFRRELRRAAEGP